MAYVIAERVKDQTVTSGTGAFSLIGTTVTGYRAFNSVVVPGDTCPYAIQDTATGAWEVGIGTYTAPNTLDRTTIIASSNSGIVVSFPAGTKSIWLDALAQDIQSTAVSDGNKGDLTVSSSGTVWDLNAAVVAYANIQDVSANQVLGRTTGAGVTEEIPCTAAGRALLAASTAAAQAAILGVVPSQYDDITALEALTSGDVDAGQIVSLKYGNTLGGYGNSDFVVFTGSAASNGYTADGIVIVENSAGDTTFVRQRYLDRREIDLMWYSPATDGTTDSASQITDFFTALRTLAPTVGHITGIIPDIGKAFLSSAEQTIGSYVRLTGGGILKAHSSLAQSSNLLRTDTLSGGFFVYGQNDVIIENLTFDGGSKVMNILTQRQSLVRLYSINGLTIRNCTFKNHDSTTLAIGGDENVEIRGCTFNNWGFQGNGVVVSGAANNGVGLIRLTVASTARMTTGDSMYVEQVGGVPAATGTWTVTVIDATHVDLQASAFAGAYTSGGTISAGVDGGSGITAIANPIDETYTRDILIQNNRFETGYWNAIQCFADFFLIEDNLIKTTKESGIFCRNLNATAPGNFTRVGLVSGNTIETIAKAYIDGSGIVLGGGKALCIGNVIRDCANIGISVVSEAADTDVLSNQLISCNTDSASFGNGGGIIIRDASSTLTPIRWNIKDNTVRDEAGTRTAKYGIAVFNVSPSANVLTDITIEGNTLWQSTLLAADTLYIEAASFGARTKVRNNAGAPATVQTEGIIGASAVAVALTGTTTETALATITIPGGFMKANSRLEIDALWTVTNNANNKQVRVRLGGIGGTAFMGQTVTAIATIHTLTNIHNRNSTSSQVASPAAASVTGTGLGTSTAAITTGAINTAANVNLVITGQLANAADSVKLESYRVTLVDIE